MIDCSRARPNDLSHLPRFATILLVLLCCLPYGVSAETLSLENHGLRVGLDSSTGEIVSITNRLTSEEYRIKTSPTAIETSVGILTTGTTASHRKTGECIEFNYALRLAAARISYCAPDAADSFEKTIEFRNEGPGPITIHKVVAQQFEASPAFEDIHPHYDPSQFHWLINVFLRSRRGGFYAGIENPVPEFWTKGAIRNSSWVQFDYRPNMILKAGEWYNSEPFFLGSFRRENIYVFKELGKLRRALRLPKALPSALNFVQEVLDWGEVWAIQDFMRALQPAHDSARPGFYVRVVGMVGGRKTAGMSKATGFHIAFGPEHVDGSKQFVDEIAELGHIVHVEWTTEWFGVGGYANPTRDFQLENAGPGEKPPVNPYWLDVVKHGWEKGIQTGIFETASRNFARNKSEWKVLRRDGTPWTWGRAKLPTNCWANPEYAKWRLEVTDAAVHDYKLYMTAWDAIVPAYWAWLGWPALETECYATNHGHPPGDITYPLYRNISWFLQELQKKNPKLAMRVAGGLTTSYPWILKNLIEYHPDFYDGETGATYWISYNFRFLPMFKSGVLLSATSRAQFEWLLLRSISVSDHFMLWPDAVPVALENKDFWRKWLTWADHHIDYLRVGRTLFREPWGDNVVASLPPALEGSLPASDAAIHGSAHCIKNRGYLFLFNPSSHSRVASIPITSWLGLTEGDQFVVRVLYPAAAEYGPYRRGEEMKIEIPANRVMVQEIAPAARQAARGRPQVSASAPVDKAFLRWDEIPWREIEPVP